MLTDVMSLPRLRKDRAFFVMGSQVSCFTFVTVVLTVSSKVHARALVTLRAGAV